MNLLFWQLTIATRPRYKFKNKIDIVNHAVNNAMILPCNIDHDKTNNGFAIITENWKYMSHKNIGNVQTSFQRIVKFVNTELINYIKINYMYNVTLYIIKYF